MKKSSTVLTRNMTYVSCGGIKKQTNIRNYRLLGNQMSVWASAQTHKNLVCWENLKLPLFKKKILCVPTFWHLAADCAQSFPKVLSPDKPVNSFPCRVNISSGTGILIPYIPFQIALHPSLPPALCLHYFPVDLLKSALYKLMIRLLNKTLENDTWAVVKLLTRDPCLQAWP